MYTSGKQFRAPFGFANHDSSSTRKCIPAVYIFMLLLVPPITIPVQHENVHQQYTISCSFWFRQSRFQFNTKMYTSGIQFRAPFGSANHNVSSTRKCIPAVYNFVLFQSNKYAFLRVSGATLLCLGASLWVPPH